MTHPQDPEVPAEPVDEAVATPEPPPATPGPSLSDRLAELEPDDDDEPLFDVDPYDEDPFDAYEPPSDQPPAYEPYAPAPYEPAVVDLSAGYPATEAEPGTAYDDSAFTTADDVPADDVPEALDPADPDAAVLAPAAPATPTDLPGPGDSALVASGAEVAAEAAAEKRRRGRRRAKRSRRLGAPVLALLLTTALMAAATAYLWLEVRDRRQVEDARRAGLDASRDAARLLFSYDYRTLQKDFGTGRALTTGDFRKEYEKTTTKLVEDAAVRYKAVVKANVVQAGVVRATADTVVTVVYVNQVTTSTRVTGEKVDLSRVRMTLRQVGGRWLVERVDAL